MAKSNYEKIYGYKVYGNNNFNFLVNFDFVLSTSKRSYGGSNLEFMFFLKFSSSHFKL